MSYKKFIITFILSIVLFLLSIASFNYFMDPNWTFSHSNRFNNIQEAPNERQQKTNAFYYKSNDYDSLLLGSSRVTFFNQYDFSNDKLYNYSFSLAMPYEYEDYINFAKKHNDSKFKKIYIGVDFFGSNKNFKNEVFSKDVFRNTTSFAYRYKSLLSIDSLKSSFFSFKAAITGKHGKRSYTRDNVTMTTAIDPNKVKKSVENTDIKNYQGDIKHYIYNDDLKKLFLKLKQDNPNTEFIIFTTPTSSYYLSKIFSLGHLDGYKLWLSDLVDVFGKVYHFMDYNSVTLDYPNYFMDYHHLYPRYTTWIADSITLNRNDTIPKDFGKVLNKENIKSYLDTIHYK